MSASPPRPLSSSVERGSKKGKNTNFLARLLPLSTKLERGRGGEASVALLALLALLGPSAQANGVRPGAGATVRLGAPPGPSPVLRGDNRRTGRAPGFPAALAPLWKTQLQGGLDFPAVASGGALVLATASGQLVSLELASGKELTRVALPAPPAQAPLITARGDRVVVTSGGECVGVGAAGELRYRVPLPARPRELGAAPLPVGGGVLVAAGRALLLLDSDGRVSEQVRLPEAPVGALVESPSGVLAVSDAGRVYRWKPPEAPVLVGALGGPPTSPAALAGKLLVGVVESHRLVFFDLAAGVPGTTVSSAASLEGPVAVGADNEAWLLTSTGLLMAISAEGKELERVAMSSGASADGAPPGPALLVAPERVALVRPSGEVALWSRSGTLSSEQRACAEPLGMVSDGERLVVSCRDGTVAAFGSKP